MKYSIISLYNALTRYRIGQEYPGLERLNRQVGGRGLPMMDRGLLYSVQFTLEIFSARYVLRVFSSERPLAFVIYIYMVPIT